MKWDNRNLQRVVHRQRGTQKDDQVHDVCSCQEQLDWHSRNKFDVVDGIHFRRSWVVWYLVSIVLVFAFVSRSIDLFHSSVDPPKWLEWSPKLAGSWYWTVVESYVCRDVQCKCTSSRENAERCMNDPFTDWGERAWKLLLASALDSLDCIKKKLR